MCLGCCPGVLGAGAGVERCGDPEDRGEPGPTPEDPRAIITLSGFSLQAQALHSLSPGHVPALGQRLTPPPLPSPVLITEGFRRGGRRAQRGLAICPSHMMVALVNCPLGTRISNSTI